MTITDEPGYYEDGAFGIRIENVLFVKRADSLPCSFGGDGVWMEFTPLTCVPISTRMIFPGQLSSREKTWLNSYNAWVLGALGPLLSVREADKASLAWLVKETAPVL